MTVAVIVLASVLFLALILVGVAIGKYVKVDNKLYHAERRLELGAEIGTHEKQQAATKPSGPGPRPDDCYDFVARYLGKGEWHWGLTERKANKEFSYSVEGYYHWIWQTRRVGSGNAPSRDAATDAAVALMVKEKRAEQKQELARYKRKHFEEFSK